MATIAGVLLLSDRAQSRATSGMARQLHAYEQLSDGIAQLLATPQLHATKFGIAVYSLDRDTLIVAHNMHEPLVPASLTKLYYTATAFATMGPRYAIRTVLATDGVLRDGTLEGNLYIIGHGDCLLASADLEALADRLVALGIKRITGAIVADATHFDPITDRQQYSGDAERMENLPPITALGIDGNRFTVIVTRGAGDRVRVHTLPASSGVVVQWLHCPSLLLNLHRASDRKSAFDSATGIELSNIEVEDAPALLQSSRCESARLSVPTACKRSASSASHVRMRVSHLLLRCSILRWLQQERSSGALLQAAYALRAAYVVAQHRRIFVSLPPGSDHSKT